MRDCLADVCADLSRFHGITDITAMGSADFFAAAERLPYYEGAVTKALMRAAEARKAERPALTLAEMRGAEYGARDGMAAVFEIDQVGAS